MYSRYSEQGTLHYVFVVGMTEVWTPLLFVRNWRRAVHGSGEKEREPAISKVVVSELVDVAVMVLLCDGDIETNPGPGDTLALNYLLRLLEEVVVLMRDIFRGGKGQSYPCKAGNQADKLTKALTDLRMNSIKLRCENHRQLENDFVGHVAQNFEVLDLFYKLYRYAFLGKPFLVRFAMLHLSFYMFLTGNKQPEDFGSWFTSCLHILCVVTHWTVRGSTICEKLVSSGLLYSNIYFIQELSCYPVNYTMEVRH